MPARNYKAQSDLAIKKDTCILDISAIWLVNTKPQKICKCLAEFYPEELATHVVSQC